MARTGTHETLPLLNDDGGRYAKLTSATFEFITSVSSSCIYTLYLDTASLRDLCRRGWDKGLLIVFERRRFKENENRG